MTHPTTTQPAVDTPSALRYRPLPLAVADAGGRIFARFERTWDAACAVADAGAGARVLVRGRPAWIEGQSNDGQVSLDAPHFDSARNVIEQALSKALAERHTLRRVRLRRKGAGRGKARAAQGDTVLATLQAAMHAGCEVVVHAAGVTFVGTRVESCDDEHVSLADESHANGERNITIRRASVAAVQVKGEMAEPPANARPEPSLASAVRLEDDLARLAGNRILMTAHLSPWSQVAGYVLETDDTTTTIETVPGARRATLRTAAINAIGWSA